MIVITDSSEAYPSLNCSPVGVCLHDDTGRVIFADPVVNSWLSRASLTVNACTLPQFLRSDELMATMDVVISKRCPAVCTGELQTGGAAAIPVQVSLRPLAGASGNIILATIHRAAPAFAVVFDALTGLPDRRAIALTVEQWRQSSADQPFAVLLVDLDDFKAVNDCHGHSAGDRVLEQLASRWMRCVREGDLVARYGGDEFVLLLKDVATLVEAEPVMHRLREATVEPIRVGELELRVSATIGVALAEDCRGAIEPLIDQADRDMYSRKRRLPR